MLKAVQGIFASKKWLMVIIGSAIIGVMQHFGVSETIMTIVGSLFGVGVLGQGAADLGKEAAKIK